MYDDYRRVFRDLDVAGQFRRALDDASLRHIRDATAGTREILRHIDDYAVRQAAALDFHSEPLRALHLAAGRQHLLEAAAIGQRAAQAFGDSFRSHAEKVAALQPAFDRERDQYAAQSSKLAIMDSAALTRAHLHIEALQRQLTDSAALGPVVDSATLKSLYYAQARWSEMAQMPTSVAAIVRLAAETHDVFRTISDLFGRLEAASQYVEVDEDEDDLALALARERIEVALGEPDPFLFLQQVGALLSQLKTGTIKLAPRVLFVLLTLLLNVTSDLIYDKVVAPRTNGTPRVEKQLVREARRLRREVPNLSADTRVVIASSLIVRRGPGRTFEPVGQLRAGNLVCLERTKTRSWSLVVFRDGDVLLRGWVFSRYLKPLRGTGPRPRDDPRPSVTN